MSADKPKSASPAKPGKSAEKSRSVAPVQTGGGGAKSAVPAASEPPLFRPIDWWTFAIAFIIIGIVYFFSLAPDVTLEDSGELSTASFYAGIPHPPGYPFWTIYTWLWTVLVPLGTVVWRVELAEAAAAAMG